MATDIVFLFDTTGSMGTYRSMAIQNMRSVAAAAGSDVRFGLVAFGDIDDPRYSNTLVNYGISDTVDDFVSNLESVTSTDGGDVTESGLEAVTEALTMNFREGAERRFIVITDAPYHDDADSYSSTGDLSTFLNAQTVLAQVKEANVQVDVVGTTLADQDGTDGGGYCETEWRLFTDNTGGEFYDINGDFPDIFRNVVVKESYTHQLSLAQWSFGFNPVSYVASDTTTSALIAGSPSETNLSTSAMIMDEFAAAKLTTNMADGAMTQNNSEAQAQIQKSNIIPITFGA